jgi:hypothetical protein
MIIAELNARFRLDRRDEACSGFIELIRSDLTGFYAGWNLVDSSGEIVATRTRKYFTGISKIERCDMLRIIEENIETFRIGRKKVFYDVTIQATDDRE